MPGTSLTFLKLRTMSLSVGTTSSPEVPLDENPVGDRPSSADADGTPVSDRWKTARWRVDHTLTTVVIGRISLTVKDLTIESVMIEAVNGERGRRHRSDLHRTESTRAHRTESCAPT